MNRIMNKEIGKKITAIAIICLLLMAESFCCAYSSEEDLPVSVIRVSGSNRYVTSLRTAEVIREEAGRQSFDSVIIASGTSFPDALSGAYLSCRLTAPVILVNDSSIRMAADYIKGILSEDGKVYILGGTGAVPESVENILKDACGCETVRLGGQDRYETNLMILKSVEPEGGELLVCTGKEYADSLSASATGLPVLLVKDRLTDEQEKYITERPGVRITILGGTGAVDQAIEDRIAGLGAECRRLSGRNREDTSYLTAEAFYPDSEKAVIAYSRNYPDGLCGGLLAYGIKAPILLVSESGYEPARKYVSDNGVLNGRIIGGRGVVSDLTASRIFGCAEEDVHEWEGRKICSITYQMNGGVNSEDNPDHFLSGDVIKLAVPQKENYAFQGWYLDKSFTQRIDYITGAIQNDVTLYAKWYLAGINVNETGNGDMIWSWWYSPQVISDDSDGLKLFWGFTGSEGYSGVAEYDDKTASVTKTFLKKTVKVDDHNGTAVEIMPDGRIMCAYSAGHDLEKEVHVRISERPLDISSFNTDIVLESCGKTSYSQIIRSGGRYYLFYRINSKLWAYRYSDDGCEWGGEVILVRADEQYYCRFVKTTDDGLIRILMYSNPAGNTNEIRMGFIDCSSGTVLNADRKTVLGQQELRYDLFDVLLEPEEGKTQRLFDAAVTSPDAVRLLFASFTNKKNTNDSVYYLYDSGVVTEICSGGKALWDPKYQLGASFFGADRIVSARNEDGKDIVELYDCTEKGISLSHTLFSEDTSGGDVRNARPITDRNGRAVLWHRGYYDPSVYTCFETSACIWFADEDLILMDDSFSGTENELRIKDYSEIDEDCISAACEYIDKTYSNNLMDDYTKGDFSWYYNDNTRSWLYTTGFMIQGFLELNAAEYSPMIKDYYRQHINDDGSITNYIYGELDSVLPAVGMIDLIDAGLADEEEKALYDKAIGFVYGQLEKQTVYPQAGMLYQHSERDGVPTSAWSRWNTCLDGIYMSQVFLIRLADAIDAGKIEIAGRNGEIVEAEKIRDDIYSRFCFVMENMRDGESGLPHHGYSVSEGITNGVSWSRGTGWFAMALMEAAEKFPEGERKEKLIEYFNELMGAVVRWQDDESFLWYNVADHREEVTDNIPESSASGMFAYCLLKGSSMGLLEDPELKTAGVRAFNALVRDRLGEDGLTDIMASSGVTSNIDRYAVNHYVTDEAKGIAALALTIRYVDGSE